MLTIAVLLLVQAAFAQNDPSVLQYPSLPGLLTAEGYTGGILGHGYDPLLGETRAALVPPTYSHYDGGMNLIEIEDHIFKFPDSIVVAEYSHTSSVTSATFMASYDDYMQWSESESSSSGFFLIGAYARQSVHGYMREKLQEQSYAAMLGGQAETTYKATMRWDPVLLRYFYGANFSDAPIALDQALLPETRTSDEDKAAYQAFIDKYGTHYLDTAEFGGHCHLVFTMNSSFVRQTNISFSEEMSAFGLTLGFFSIGFGSGGAHAKASITSEAKSMSEMAFVGYGGSQALLQTGLYSLWRDTIPLSAAPINSTYTPISEIILDENKRGLMDEAVKDYLNVSVTKPNAPFGLLPVQCGTSPGSANTSIDAIPTSGGLGRGADRPGARETMERAWSEGAASLRRRAQEPEPLHRPTKPVQEVTIKTDAGPMRVRMSSSEPMAMGPTDLDARAMPAQALDLREGGLGGFILPVPGPDRGVGFGYDPVAGGLRAPIVASSAHLSNTTWFDPATNITWLIPDGWTFASTPFSCAEEVARQYESASLVASFNAKISMMGIGFSFDGIGIGAFFSKEREDAKATLRNFQDGYFGLDRSVSLFRLSAGHGLRSADMLRGEFVEAVNALPTDPSNASFGLAYNEFLSTYGTHYVHQAALGGSCSIGVSYNQSALAAYSQEYKKTQFGIMIGFMFEGIGINFDLGLSKAQFTESVNQAFAAASTYHIDCVGGDPSKLQALDYIGWLLSVGFNPTLVPGSTRLRPMYELVSFDTTRRALLQQQSQAYFNATGGN